MDAGASVAAFIGLVGLVAQSTTSLIRLLKDIRDTPGTHQSNLKWLEQLSCVLKDLQNTGSTLQQAKLTIDLSTMEEYLRGCHEAIDVLRAHLEKSLNGLRSTGFEKRKATLKAYFGSRNADCQIQNIRRAMEGLSLCHSSIMGTICVHSHRSIQELTAQTNDLTLGTQDIRRNIQQLQHVNLGTLQGVQNLGAAHEWMAAVQGVLPLEIRNLVRNAIAEELRSASQDQQTPSNEGFRKQTLSLNPGIQNVLPLERPVTAPTSPKLDNTSDHQSFEQFQEMEKDFLPRYQNRDDGHTTFLSNMQEQRPYIKSKILMFSWYYRAFFGYFSVVVSERHQVTAGREENVLHIDIRIFPWRWISSWGFRARILYDRTHGLSSPTNIQLESPRIIPVPFTNDGIWRLFCEQKSDSIIDSIRSGVYRPDDMLEMISCPTDDFEVYFRYWEGPTSLLTIASLFGDVKVVRFLLQQGARVDQSDFHVFGIRRSEGDLYRALVPTSWWIPWDWVVVNSIAKETRLDTARLLINAGSDFDSISVAELVMWASYWDLETILSVVGNRYNSPWDAIQLDLGSLHWFLTLFNLDDTTPPRPYFLPDNLLECQSKFEKFVELCKRLKIDPAFTQPNGLNILHWVIKESKSFGRTSRLEHCLSLLITHGVDPCAVSEGYLTPTFMAFVENGLDPWFTVLRQLGISVEAVAAHALGLLTRDIILSLTPKPIGRVPYTPHDLVQWRFYDPDRGWSIFIDIKQLKVDLIEAFESQGCYLNQSGDRGDTVTHKASSSVDFKPSTVYDPERAEQDFRRRTEGQKHPQ